MVGAVATLGAAGLSAASAYAINQANLKANESRWSDEINLANTQHQREVADLRLAGLNPILSTGTAGAAVPTQNAATQTNPLNDVTEGVSSAFREYMSRETAKSNLAAIREEVEGIKKDNASKDVELEMLRRQNWLQGLGLDDIRRDGQGSGTVRVGSQIDEHYNRMREYYDKLRELQREGYISDATIRARASAQQIYEDIIQGADTVSDIIPVKALGKAAVGDAYSKRKEARQERAIERRDIRRSQLNKGRRR